MHPIAHKLLKVVWNPVFFTIFPMVLLFTLPFILADFGSDRSPVSGQARAQETGAAAEEKSLPDDRPRKKRPRAEARKRPVWSLLDRIGSGKYRRPGEVATGRFLRDFGRAADMLAIVRENELRLERRGVTTVEVDVTPSELRPDASPGKTTPIGHLRFVRDDGVWKLENVELDSAVLEKRSRDW